MLPFSGRRFLVILLGLFVLNWLLVQVFAPAEKRIEVPYTPTFLTQVRDGNVKEIASTGETVQGEFKKEVTFEDEDGRELRDRGADLRQRGGARPAARGAGRRGQREVGRDRPVGGGGACSTFGPTVLFVACSSSCCAVRRGAGGGGMIGPRALAGRALQHEARSRVTFDDVAGIDEAKAELTEIVDFLRSSGQVPPAGRRIPRGVLLSGPPGTGKTLLARAVAGEAGVPFFSCPRPEFIEMIVGVGASRVRDLFSQAKAGAPAIIFIDELDAIGRAPGRRLGASAAGTTSASRR